MKTLENYICEGLATEEQMEIIEGLNDYEKLQVNVVLYDWEDLDNALENYMDVEIYENMDYTQLAEHFVDEGMMWEIPENLARYFDFEALGRDLSYDWYAEFDVEGVEGIYRMM